MKEDEDSETGIVEEYFVKFKNLCVEGKGEF